MNEYYNDLTQIKIGFQSILTSQITQKCLNNKDLKKNQVFKMNQPQKKQPLPQQPQKKQQKRK